MLRTITVILFLLIGCSAAGQLRAGFSTDKMGGCSPLVVQFTNRSTGASANASYHWDFGNGNTAAVADAQAVYTDIATYTVTLTVQDGTQTSSASQTVTVYAPPTVAFSADLSKVCIPAAVTYTAGGSGAGPGGSGGAGSGGSAAGSSYLWDFGDGTTQSGGAIVSHSYQNAGMAGASLTVTDLHGCVTTLTQTNLVTVLPRLQASFTTNKQVLCAATDPVAFTNNSVGPGTLSYQWSFGDGNGSTQTSPSYSYPEKGTYTVILKATSSEGCSAADTQSNFLNVANYKTDFSQPNPVCLGSVAVFSDASVPVGDSRVWQIDGAPAGNGTPLSWYFPSAGTHTIALTDVFGNCSQSVTKTYTVNAPPTPAAFDIDIQGKCGAPVNVSFLDHTPGAVSWAWVFQYQPYSSYQTVVNGGPGNSFNYGSDGTNDVELTVTNAAGCSASIIEPVTITTPIVAIYAVSGTPQTCGQPVTETLAIIHPELLQSYSWDFGDGTGSGAVSPTHTWTAPGSYNIVLHYTTLDGCTGLSNTLYVTISKPFNVDFNAEATTVCAGAAVAFGGASLASDGAIYTSWDFGDGSPQSFSGDGAYHVYYTPGVYTVTLQVSNAGCQAAVVKTNYITVLASPTVGVTHTNTCAGSRGDVTFSVATGGGASSLAWNFGDGVQLSTGAGITQLVHTYTATGMYTVTVTASNGGCSASGNDVVYVLVKQKPVLSASVGSVCPDGTLVVALQEDPNPLAVYGSGTYSYQYQYGDSTNFQGSVIGLWNLSEFQGGEGGLRVITTSYYFGCNDTSNIFPLVIKGAAAGYSILQDNRCYMQPVVLQDTSRVNGGDKIVSWLWDFGDGTSTSSGSSSGTVSHRYAQPGSYSVKLTVQDAGGCAASSLPAVAQVVADGPEAAAYSPGGNSVPVNAVLTFVNSSNTTGAPGAVWSWDFGDGSPAASDFSPSHAYAVPGTYTVVLTARDASGGCVSSASLTIVVTPFNSAFRTSVSYVAPGGCPPVLAQFTNTSVNYSSLTWDFGDGEMVTGVVNPSHVYARAGTYMVTLTVVGLNGRVLTTLDSVVVAQPSTVMLGGGVICQGQGASFEARKNKGVSGYTWDFGDGVVMAGAAGSGAGGAGAGSAADSNATHVYQTAGQYAAKLIVTDGQGCSVASDPGVAVDVHALPVVVLTPGSAVLCLNAAVALSATGGVGYSWSPVAGLSDALAAAPMASPVVTTVYTVTVADALGCTDTASLAVQVVQPETVRVDPDSVAICAGKSVVLSASGTDQYSWIGAGLSDAGTAAPVATPLVPTIYKVVGSDAHACFSDTAMVIVNVLPLPTVDAGPDMVVQADAPVTLPGVGSGDIVSWQWTPALDLSCTDCAQPVCTPKKTIPYVVMVTNASGCVASDTVVVTLLCSEAKVAIPDAFTPNGDGHNDRFNILGISEVNHLVIYDRWGQKVFERNHFFPADPGSGWDGTMSGQPAPAGVYAYFVEMQCPAGGVFMRRGTMVLVR